MSSEYTVFVTKHLHFKLQLTCIYRNTVPSVVVLKFIHFLCISSATLPCSIRRKASTIASQVGIVELFNQLFSISVLQRSTWPRWFFSIVSSWWLFKSRCTPSECQSKTDFKATLSSLRVGLAGAAEMDKNTNAWYTVYFNWTQDYFVNNFGTILIEKPTYWSQ